MKTIPKTTTRIKEHCDKQIKEHCGPGKYSSIFNHSIECNCYQYYLDLHNFPHDDVTLNNQDISEHIKNAATNNVKIIGKTEKRTEISLLGSLNIKWKKPSFDTGINSLKEHSQVWDNFWQLKAL